AMGIDGDNGWEVLDLEFPDGLGASELLEPNAQDALHALGIDLSGAPDGVEIDAAVLLARLLRFRSHPALTDDCFDTELFDDVRLIRFFTNGRRRPCGNNSVFASIFEDDRSAVIDDS